MEPTDAEKIVALQEELAQRGKKFDEWKVKAQSSVEKHREQISALTAETEELKRLSRHQKHVISSLSSWCSEHTQTFADFTVLHAKTFLASRACFVEAEMTTLKAQQNEMHAVQFEKYKKRAEQTLRLNTKDQEGMMEESTRLKAALEQSLAQLSEAREAVNQRNIALAIVEKQLDASNSVVETLQAQLEHIRSGEGGAAGDNGGVTEAELDRIRAEFGEREGIIFDQHRDEIQHMTSNFERELESLRVEDAERLAAATADLMRQAAAASSTAHRDDAYDTLLVEHDALRKTVRDMQIVESSLRGQLAKYQATATPLPCDGRAAAQTATTGANQTPAQQQKRIQDLEKHVSHLSDQLWSLSHSALEAKSASKEAAGVGGATARMKPDEQQQSYFRSILVKMLSAKSDEVRGSLMPVLTTIAQLDAADLRVIYSANPSWIH